MIQTHLLDHEADIDMLNGILNGEERVDISHAGGEMQEVESQLGTDLWEPQW
jgi:hypothetical protein